MRDSEVKRYYVDVDRFDSVTHPKRVSKWLHRLREAETARLLTQHCLDGSVLDLGCGCGLITRDIACARLVGVDINTWALSRAASHCSGVAFVAGDAEKLPVRSKSFDAVVCTEALEHLPNPDVAVAEVMRVLRPGGLFLGSVPNRSALRRLPRAILISPTCTSSVPLHRLYVRRSLAELLGSFETLRIQVTLLGLHLTFVARKRAEDDE